MFGLKKRLAGAMLALGVAAVGTAIVAAPASAVPAADPAPQCGYYVSDGYSWYNHCGSGNAYIQIDQVLGHYEQCVGPGSTLLRKNDGGLYAITNAFYLRPC